MEKRTVKIGSYDTAAYGWTLSGLKLGDPEVKESYADKPGGDGSWDFTTALTGGIPRYKKRPLTVKLECSEGRRSDREDLINDLVNTVDGFEWDIILPDRPDHFIHGRLRVAVDYSDLAHAAVTITGSCEPWFYSCRESVVELTCAGESYPVTIRNAGRRAVVPTLTVDGNLQLSYAGAEAEFSTGTHKWPTLLLTPGMHAITCSGNGSIILTFREAVLR